MRDYGRALCRATFHGGELQHWPERMMMAIGALDTLRDAYTSLCLAQKAVCRYLLSCSNRKGHVAVLKTLCNKTYLVYYCLASRMRGGAEEVGLGPPSDCACAKRFALRGVYTAWMYASWQVQHWRGEYESGDKALTVRLQQVART